MSARLWLSVHIMLVYSIHVSQGVATSDVFKVWCSGGIFNDTSLQIFRRFGVSERIMKIRSKLLNLLNVPVFWNMV